LKTSQVNITISAYAYQRGFPLLLAKSARLVWWNDSDKTWEEDNKDPAFLYVDGSALQALRQVIGVAAGN